MLFAMLRVPCERGPAGARAGGPGRPGVSVSVSVSVSGGASRPVAAQAADRIGAAPNWNEERPISLERLATVYTACPQEPATELEGGSSEGGRKGTGGEGREAERAQGGGRDAAAAGALRRAGTRRAADETSLA